MIRYTIDKVHLQEKKKKPIRSTFLLLFWPPSPMKVSEEINWSEAKRIIKILATLVMASLNERVSK